MARHGERGSDGRFSVSTKNTPEVSEHTVKGIDTYADGLPVDNASVSGRGPLNQARYAASSDGLPGTGRLHPRRGIVIDGDSGEHLADLTANQLRAFAPRLRTDNHIRAADGDDHLDYLVSGE